MSPGLAPVMGHGGHQTVRAAVVPAILLVDADDVVGIRRVDVDPGLDLGVDIVRARAADRAAGEGTWARGQRQPRCPVLPSRRTCGGDRGQKRDRANQERSCYTHRHTSSTRPETRRKYAPAGRETNE